MFISFCNTSSNLIKSFHSLCRRKTKRVSLEIYNFLTFVLHLQPGPNQRYEKHEGGGRESGGKREAQRENQGGVVEEANKNKKKEGMEEKKVVKEQVVVEEKKKKNQWTF